MLVFKAEALKIDKEVIISTRGIITLEKVLEENKKTKSFKEEEILRQKFLQQLKKTT